MQNNAYSFAGLTVFNSVPIADFALIFLEYKTKSRIE